MPARTVNQLSDGDAIFLSMETSNSAGHVGAVMVLDPTTSPGFGFERLREHVARRLSLVPRFGWKLRRTLFDHDRPYWVEAGDYDPRDHVVRTAVPAPGNDRQLAALTARLHAQPLDPTRPLWEIWIIEGLADGRIGMYMKTHHALVDGSGGAGLMAVLADLSPEPSETPFVPDAYVETAPATPSALEIASRSLRNAASRPGRFFDHLGRGVRSLARRSPAQQTEVPKLFFNEPISRRRGFATARIDFERVRDLKKHFDVTVNDVVLTLVGSAMSRWLRERGEQPEASLVAMCPVSTREGDSMGNQITSMAVPLATDVSDPAARLCHVHENARAAKEEVADGTHFDWTAALGESMAPAFTQLVVRAAYSAADSAPLPGNFVVSNVRATPTPLYLDGARVESMMPMSILAVGQGLNVTVVSYTDHIDVGILVDPDLVPDAWEFAAQFDRALEELELAAEGVVYRAA
ncbi:MAG: wax ester/triacylglycerol synthase family O-acyltransferase [Myxococcota bacterium]